MSSALLDTQHALQTPEGVELRLRVAGPVVRALAWLIDFSLRLLVYLAIVLLASMLGKVGEGMFLLSFFLLEWFYPVLFEVYHEGATPGKARMGLKVLNQNGTPVGWTGAMLRNLLRAVDALPLFYACGLFSLLLTRNFQRLGDLAAGTLVVYNDIPSPKPSAQSSLPQAAPLSLPQALNATEQRAIISFAERASILPPSRVMELADLASDLTGETGEASAQRLYRMANGLYR